MGRLQRVKERVRILFSNKSTKPCIVDRIPVELLQLIFELACTDNGATGCSLSLVSKRFQMIARISRFNFIALRSGHTRQIAQFTSCLVAERQRAGPASSLVKVRHLFLASARRTVRRNHPGAREELEQYQSDVFALVELVSPDLYTLLFLSNYCGWQYELRPPNIGLVRYPELRELSLYGYGARFAPMAPYPQTWEGLDNLPNTEDLTTYPPLPKLSHLHITSYPEFVWTSNPNLRHWAERAPGMTHLCLSNWKYYHEHIAPTVADVIGLRDRPLLFERLETLIVQADASPPGPGPGPAPSSVVPTELFATLEELRVMHRRSTRGWALVPPLVPLLHNDKEYLYAAEQEWACWEAGLPGCWAIDESYFVPA